MPRIDGINPLLVYDDIQAAHDFLVSAFGFTSGGVERGDDQRVVHAQVRAGDTTVWQLARLEGPARERPVRAVGEALLHGRGEDGYFVPAHPGRGGGRRFVGVRGRAAVVGTDSWKGWAMGTAGDDFRAAITGLPMWARVRARRPRR